MTNNMLGLIEFYHSRVSLVHQMTEERKLADVVPQLDPVRSSIYFVEKEIESQTDCIIGFDHTINYN